MKILFFTASIIMFLIAPVFSQNARIELGADWAKSYLEEVLKGRKKTVIKEHGLVPDSETAIAIAVSIWNPIYGKENIAKQSPFFAYQVSDYWVVTGSLPQGWKGGTAKCVISKKDASVIHVMHYK